MDVRKGSAWTTIRTGEAYVGAAWRTLQYGEAYISGAWRRIVSFVTPYTALTISPISPSASSFTSDTSTTNNIIATPTGGLSPFTYSWVLLSSSGLTGISISRPTSASTTFTATVTPGGEGTSGTASFRCTGTDSLGTAQSATISVGFEHSIPPGGTA